MTPLKSQAIQTALRGDWQTAISLNKRLLKENPNDIETLNRLAFAFMVLGKAKEAKQMYQKVLSLDSQNPIALKSLRRLTSSPKNGFQTHQLATDMDTLFLEETGKTKVIELVNVAEPRIVANLMTGELLTLQVKRLKIFVLDEKKRYIGMLPDDIGKRLIRLLKGGNCYQVYIKAIEARKVTAFFRETKRVTRFKNQPSFVSTDKTKSLMSKHHAMHKDTDIYISEDEEEDSVAV